MITTDKKKSYTMIFVFPVLFFGWKLLKRTKRVRPSKVDLRPPEFIQVEEYQASYVPTKADTRLERILDKVFG